MGQAAHSGGKRSCGCLFADAGGAWPLSSAGAHRRPAHAWQAWVLRCSPSWGTQPEHPCPGHLPPVLPSLLSGMVRTPRLRFCVCHLHLPGGLGQLVQTRCFLPWPTCRVCVAGTYRCPVGPLFSYIK